MKDMLKEYWKQIIFCNFLGFGLVFPKFMEIGYPELFLVPFIIGNVLGLILVYPFYGIAKNMKTDGDNNE